AGVVDGWNDADRRVETTVHPPLDRPELLTQPFLVRATLTRDRPGRDRRQQDQLRHAAHKFRLSAVIGFHELPLQSCGRLPKARRFLRCSRNGSQLTLWRLGYAFQSPIIVASLQPPRNEANDEAAEACHPDSEAPDGHVPDQLQPTISGHCPWGRVPRRHLQPAVGAGRPQNRGSDGATRTGDRPSRAPERSAIEKENRLGRTAKSQTRPIEPRAI